jgi:hypothetical protein
MKTVLAPNAPWPVQVEAKQPKIRVRKQRANKSKTDQNFERWLSGISPIKTKGNNNA